MLPHIDQIAESDINLVTRVAADLDAVAKPGGGRLVVAQRGESVSASGQTLPARRLTPANVSRYSWSTSLREPAGTVVATWRDTGAAEDKEEQAGDGDPVRRLRRTFPDQASAAEGAKAEHKKAQRLGTGLNVSLPGDPDLAAEGRLELSGFRSEVDGEWLIRSVTHRLSKGQGYTCDVSAERPEGDPAT